MQGWDLNRYKKYVKEYRAFCMYESLQSNEYFFTTDHCQSVQENTHVPSHFVSMTCYLPCHVVPQPRCPSGVLNDLTSYLNFFHENEKEIENPDPAYRVDRVDLEQLLS